MNTIKLSTWTHLKRLLVLVEQYYSSTNVYDCTFPVLAGDIARQFSNTKNNAFYMVEDGDKDVGFLSIYLDTTMLHNEMWIEAAYFIENYRKKGLFREHFLPIIFDLDRMMGIKRTKFSADIDKEVWEHITGRPVRVEKIMVIDHISEEQDATLT